MGPIILLLDIIPRMSIWDMFDPIIPPDEPVSPGDCATACLEQRPRKERQPENVLPRIAAMVRRFMTFLHFIIGGDDTTNLNISTLGM
jgi:hypothetical protein